MAEDHTLNAVGEPQIKDRETLEAWLETQPREVAVVVAARAALRVLPAIAIDIRWSNSATRQTLATSLLLPVFQALAKSWTTATFGFHFWPAAVSDGFLHEADQAFQEADGIRAAANSVSIVEAAANAAEAVHEENDFTEVVDCAAHAVASAALAVASDGVISYQTYDDFFARSIWDSTGVDILFIKSTIHRYMNNPDEIANSYSLAISSLIRAPLWKHSEPDWLRQNWIQLRQRLEELNSNWQVWIDWFEKRLKGDARDYTIERLFVDVPYEMRGAKPAEINAEITRRIREIEPPTPSSTPGPGFAFTEDWHLDHPPELPNPDELENESIRKQHERLRQRSTMLNGLCGGIENQHPILTGTIADFADAIDRGFDALDIDEVWMTGVGLVEQAYAYRNLNNHGLTPALEPEPAGLLQECSTLYARFIVRFEEGQAILNESAIPAMSADALLDLAAHQRSFIHALRTKYGDLLTDRARRIAELADHQLLKAGMKVDGAVKVSYPVVRNVLVTVGAVIQRVAIPVAGGLVAGGAADGMVSAWLQAFQAESATILGFASNFPELREYFLWLYRRLEDLEKETAS